MSYHSVYALQVKYTGFCPMIFAALAHVDGNVHALRAALSAIDDHGIHEIVAAGNFVCDGDAPGEVIDLLRERGVHCTMGLSDRRVVRAVRKKQNLSTDDAARATYDALTTAQLEWLGDLPLKRELAFDGTTVTVYFGSPSNIARVLASDDKDMVFQRLAEDTRTQVNVLAGTGTPFNKHIGNTLFVASGRVSHPDHAQYAIIDTDTSPITVEHRAAEIASA